MKKVIDLLNSYGGNMYLTTFIYQIDDLKQLYDLATLCVLDVVTINNNIITLKNVLAFSEMEYKINAFR